jgi:hypothetical protein
MHQKDKIYKEEEIRINDLKEYPEIFTCPKCGKDTNPEAICIHCKTQYVFLIKHI